MIAYLSILQDTTCLVMRGTPPALQIAAENFLPGDIARSESGELSEDEHRVVHQPLAHT